MSHQSNINIDEQLTETYRLDTAPQYRRDIFGSVFPTTALERKNNRKKEFNRIWGLDKVNDEMDKFREQIKETQKSSEERNEALNKLLN